LEREDSTNVMVAFGRRSVPVASISACRFDPEPEMRTVMRRVRSMMLCHVMYRRKSGDERINSVQLLFGGI
jgi:hypothetical protein